MLPIGVQSFSQNLDIRLLFKLVRIEENNRNLEYHSNSNKMQNRTTKVTGLVGQSLMELKMYGIDGYSVHLVCLGKQFLNSTNTCQFKLFTLASKSGTFFVYFSSLAEDVTEGTNSRRSSRGRLSSNFYVLDSASVTRLGGQFFWYCIFCILLRTFPI